MAEQTGLARPKSTITILGGVCTAPPFSRPYHRTSIRQCYYITDGEEMQIGRRHDSGENVCARGRVVPIADSVPDAFSLGNEFSCQPKPGNLRFSGLGIRSPLSLSGARSRSVRSSFYQVCGLVKRAGTPRRVRRKPPKRTSRRKLCHCLGHGSSQEGHRCIGKWKRSHGNESPSMNARVCVHAQ